MDVKQTRVDVLVETAEMKGAKMCRKHGTLLLASVVAFAILVSGDDAWSQVPACDEPYTVQPNETLTDLARRAYANPDQWSIIYYQNQEALPSGPSNIQAGTEITIPCLTPSMEFVPIPPEATGEIESLTASDYAPFTDETLSGGGLITEIVHAAFNANPMAPTHSVTWINDWSSHLDPLLMNRSFDMGFPWLKPDCGDASVLSEDGRFRCETFLFSDQVFEMLVMLFISEDNPIPFDRDEDMEGRTLCRPAGYYTFDLDQNGRRWLVHDKITLVQPRSVRECFELLADGEVDGVTINEFTGRLEVHRMGLSDRITAHPRALSIQGLYALVPKTHPRATVILYHFNQGLRALRETDEYNQILQRHLSAYWDELS
ncbi:MAG: transporter substrate-binding domain-containing protein [Alphaproteobacteria bacterium]|nr:transporter substrate-binding domain-containing protein [Alphaproteobacteria bacterium]